MNLSATTILKSNIIFVVAILTITLLSPPISAKMYKWIDKAGVTHYTQHPPIKEESTLIAEPFKPGSTPDQAKSSKTEPKSKSGKKSAQNAKKRAQCMHVKKNLEMLEKSMNIVRKRVKGKLIAMTETERKQLIGQYRATISQHCH